MADPAVSASAAAYSANFFIVQSWVFKSTVGEIPSAYRQHETSQRPARSKEMIAIQRCTSLFGRLWRRGHNALKTKNAPPLHPRSGRFFVRWDTLSSFLQLHNVIGNAEAEKVAGRVLA